MARKPAQRVRLDLNSPAFLEVFQCLAQQSTLEGESCASACEVPDVCEFIIGELPFYADQPAACTTTLNECVETCYQAGEVENDGENFSYEDPPVYIPELVCLVGPLSGSCSHYARDTEECGGPYAEDSVERCHALCETSIDRSLDRRPRHDLRRGVRAL